MKLISSFTTAGLEEVVATAMQAAINRAEEMAKSI
ncbi:pyrroline-5-carboxylate reductase [Alishewanella longhuensis]